MKVVLDTVIWVSYATHADGARSRAIEQALRQRVRFITSDFILTEVARVLCDKLAASRRLARLTVSSLRRKCSVVALPRPARRHVASDPNDDPIIETALVGKADYVVTADKALLKLAKVQDVEVLSLEQWLSLLPPES